MQRKVHKAMDRGFEKALGSGKLELWLNGQACFDPVLPWCLHELTMNLADKSYSRDNRLNSNESSD